MAALDDRYDVLDWVHKLGLNPDSIRDNETARAAMYAHHAAEHDARAPGWRDRQREFAAKHPRPDIGALFKARYGKYAPKDDDK